MPGGSDKGRVGTLTRGNVRQMRWMPSGAAMSVRNSILPSSTPLPRITCTLMLCYCGMRSATGVRTTAKTRIPGSQLVTQILNGNGAARHSRQAALQITHHLHVQGSPMTLAL